MSTTDSVFEDEYSDLVAVEGEEPIEEEPEVAEEEPEVVVITERDTLLALEDPGAGIVYHCGMRMYDELVEKALAKYEKVYTVDMNKVKVYDRFHSSIESLS